MLVAQRVAISRTAGLYISMDAASTPTQTQRIVELREMLHMEDNSVREKSLLNVKKGCSRLYLWMHDFVCRSNFADAIVQEKMLDALHAKTHVGKLCRTRYNPRWGSNPATLKRLHISNTPICEQIWRAFTSNLQARYMARFNYRAFFRHFCIAFNKATKSRTQRSVFR